MENFGKKGRDKVTGFKGVITAKCFYMYGCAQYLITPQVDKDGKISDGQWFDDGRVEVGDLFVSVNDVKAESNGGERREHPLN